MSYDALSFIVAEVDNLDNNLGKYLKLSFIMAETSNLYVNLGCYFIYLILTQVNNFLVNIIDSMTIIGDDDLDLLD